MTFLRNHAKTLVSVDFFVVPTVTFRLLYVLIVLSHDRRRVLYFNLTSNPTAEWTAQQIVQAFPWDTSPKYLLRDRDGIYGDVFKERIKRMGIEQLLISFRSPWQSPFVERVIGSVRRECLDHMIILNERHLKSILKEYFPYYHDDRTHYNLGKETPSGRPVQSRPSDDAEVIALPRLGGLHHRYEWRVAA